MATQPTAMIPTPDDIKKAFEAMELDEKEEISPRHGRLLRLKTLAEVKAFLLLDTVYVVKVPVKQSSKILK